MSDFYLTARCTCCDREGMPPSGWYAEGYSAPLPPEHFCSKRCFDEHTDGTCPCAYEGLRMDLADDDDCDEYSRA